jgi:hypothetical protein
LKNPSAQALLKACAELEEAFAQEQAAAGHGLTEAILQKKEKSLEKLKGLLSAPGASQAWNEKDLQEAFLAARKLHAGALASARFSDFKARLSENLARVLGSQAPSVTYNKEGAKESRSDSRARIDRTH